MAKTSNPVPAELLQLFDKFAAEVEGYGLVDRPDDEPPFGFVNLLEEYDAPAAIALLNQKAPSFYGHKEATFHAFCAWAVAPLEEDVRFDFIGIAIKELLAEAERKAANLNLGSNTATDMIARYYFAGSQFIWNIYTAFQGAASFRSFGSGDYVAEHLAPLEAQFNSIVKLLTCLHYVSSNRVNSHKKPSVNLGMRFLDKLPGQQTRSSTAAYEIWGDIKDNAALIYAASSIKVTPTETLLSVILKGELNYSRDYRFFRTWIRRAKYYCDTTLSKMSEELYEANSVPLAGVEPQEFSFTLKEEELKIANDLINRSMNSKI